MQNKMYIDIKNDINLISKMVFGQMDLISEVLDKPQTAELAEKIKDNENLIDSVEVKIRSEVISAIVLYAPRAIDLRKIIAYYDINSYMERIGDHLYNVSKSVKTLDYDSEVYLNSIGPIKNMLEKVHKMTQNAIFATVYRDNVLSRDIIVSDEEVDAIKDQLVKQLTQTSNPSDFISAMMLVRITQILERIGDAATSIAKSALFIIEGVDLRHESVIPKYDE